MPSKPISLPVKIFDVAPLVEGGRVPIKRSVGEPLDVSAQIVATGPAKVGAELAYRRAGERRWQREQMLPDATEPDRFRAEVIPPKAGSWEYRIEAWVDEAATWRDEFARRVAGGDADLDVILASANERFGTTFSKPEDAVESEFVACSARVATPAFSLEADPVVARVGAWYELFPRSFGGLIGVAKTVPELADLGFDVVYLTPIHPIGATNRKGRNNTRVAKRGDPGSPWAIGSTEGGHLVVHPELGTIDDFDELVEAAGRHNMIVALDLAFQCSPDHPWLVEHPEWFRFRADGTVQYAENPPKRYEDIVNFDFSSAEWRQLWNALRGVVEFWIAHGVGAFRVDNPHTKPLAFWEWLIASVRHEHPQVFFLAEAFTRPAAMQALAKVGFNQSYTYFTWRNDKAELMSYVRELAGPMHEFFRPNFFVNTPDILSDYLHQGGEAAFRARAVLAATLSPAYGVYSGFEHFERTPAAQGSEEYLDSEKYEVKERALDGPLLDLFSSLNAIRRSTDAFSRLDNITFLETANDALIAYLKLGQPPRGDAYIICVNLDAHARSEGLLEIPGEFSLPEYFGVIDELSGERYEWRAGANYVALAPGRAHILRVVR